MLFREIFRILGVFFFFFSASFLIPILVSIYYQSPLILDFTFAFLVSFSLAILLWFLGSRSTGTFYRKEGIAAVVLIWFLVPAISTLPFLTSNTLQNPIQAYFEMVSGFTTTGSTVLHAKAYNHEGLEVPIEKTIPGVIPVKYSFMGTVEPIVDSSNGTVIKEGIEAVNQSLLFWRGFTQWLGGGGIVVLFVAILPAFGMGGKVLFQSEVASSSQVGIAPRIKQTAIQLWKIYMALTLIQVIALMIVNPALPFFEAILIAFSTISTGGFSTQNASIAGYHNPAMEWVIIFFMIAGGINFSLYYFLFKGKIYRIFEPEFLVYLSILSFLSLVVAYEIYDTAYLPFLGREEGVYNGMESIREGIFQLVSAQTSTGFFTRNFDYWPYTAQSLLLMAMFIGGMTGSTAGGIKILRNIILFKSAYYRIESFFRPEQVRVFKVGEREMDFSALRGVLNFFFILIGISAFSTVLYIFDGIDPETAFGLTTSMLNNTGMSFRMAGPEHSFAFLSNFSLLLSCVLMIFGRLEYYVVLAVLLPAFWKQE